MFLVTTSDIIDGGNWYVWFGCTLQGVGGFIGFCGACCCKSPTMIFYYFVWVVLGMCWWMLWSSLNISNMINQGYDGDMVGIVAQCIALFLWGLFCVYEINRYYNKIRSPHSYWCLCLNPGVKLCCCSVPCITIWIAKARGDDIPDIERSEVRRYSDDDITDTRSPKSKGRGNKTKTEAINKRNNGYNHRRNDSEDDDMFK